MLFTKENERPRITWIARTGLCVWAPLEAENADSEDQGATLLSNFPKGLRSPTHCALDVLDLIIIWCEAALAEDCCEISCGSLSLQVTEDLYLTTRLQDLCCSV